MCPTSVFGNKYSRAEQILSVSGFDNVIAASDGETSLALLKPVDVASKKHSASVYRISTSLWEIALMRSSPSLCPFPTLMDCYSWSLINDWNSLSFLKGCFIFIDGKYKTIIILQVWKCRPFSHKLHEKNDISFLGEIQKANEWLKYTKESRKGDKIQCVTWCLPSCGKK